MQYLPATDFLQTTQRPILDVRSPAEFQKGHIPGAANLPIFSNEERAIGHTVQAARPNRSLSKRP